MIRLSSSFFISLIIHITILVGVFFAYKHMLHTKKTVQKKKIYVKLKTLHKEKLTKNTIKKTVLKSKNIIKPKIKPKPKPKIKPKPKPKPKIKPKPKPKPKIKPKPKPKIKPKPKPKIKPKAKKEEKETIVETKTTSKEDKKTEEIYIKVDENNIANIEDKSTNHIPFATTTQQKKDLSQKYINNHQDEISKLIDDNLYYPRKARKRKITGMVKVKFNLSKNSVVSNIEVLSSHSEILSRAATKTIQNLSKKFPKPSENLTIKVPILFQLH